MTFITIFYSLFIVLNILKLKKKSLKVHLCIY